MHRRKTNLRQDSSTEVETAQRYNSGLHKNVRQHKITYTRATIVLTKSKNRNHRIDLDNRNCRISITTNLPE